MFIFDKVVKIALVSFMPFIHSANKTCSKYSINGISFKKHEKKSLVCILLSRLAEGAVQHNKTVFTLCQHMCI